MQNKTITDERDQTIADLRAAIKAKNELIADLTRDRGESRMMFANAGSALRAPTREDPRAYPCPTCHEPNCLTREDKGRGYQCDVCADRAEGRGGYE